MRSNSPDEPGPARKVPPQAPESPNSPEEPESKPETSEERGFRIDLSRSEPKVDYVRVGAGLAAAVAVIGIIVFSVTNVSETLLPMEDRYLDVLIPKTEDGSEPFVLDSLSEVEDGNRISISGRMTNASLEQVENVIAIVTVEDTTRREPAVLELPISPAVLPPGESGEFSGSVMLRAGPTGYRIHFRLENGPAVPHRDGRGLPQSVAP